MSQFDFGTLDPFVESGVALASDLNSWRNALYSMHRGATRPPYVVVGQLWINDSAGPTNWVVNIYFGATVGDKPLFTLNSSTGAITFAAAVGATFTAATLLAQAAANPQVQWNATGNAANLKNWRATATSTGALRISSYSDAGVEQAYVQFNRDGSITLSRKPESFLITATGTFPMTNNWTAVFRPADTPAVVQFDNGGNWANNVWGVGTAFPAFKAVRDGQWHFNLSAHISDGTGAQAGIWLRHIRGGATLNDYGVAGFTASFGAPFNCAAVLDVLANDIVAAAWFTNSTTGSTLTTTGGGLFSGGHLVSFSGHRL